MTRASWGDSRSVCALLCVQGLAWPPATRMLWTIVHLIAVNIEPACGVLR